MSIPNFSPIQDTFTYDLKLDTCHLKCPLPLLKTKQALSGLNSGQILWVISDQASLALDIKTLMRQTQDQLIKEEKINNLFNFIILKR